ncbi:MAG: ElaA protein [Granulosicoccus sp.]|jgi:ElaA protein
MNWEFHTFQTLDTHRLFELMKLRTDVFVVEQQCAYPELDTFDNLPNTIHLLGFDNHTLWAYARAMPIATSSNSNTIAAVKIGRVVVIKSHRGAGLANQLMKRLMKHLDENYPGKDQVLSAQAPIVTFYERLGFTTESDVYLEDGIPHVDMRRNSKAIPTSGPTGT